MLSDDPDGVLARLRGLALALAETDEVVSHGIPAFRVAGKMFAYFRHDHHGDGMTVVCVKTSGRDEAEMLIEAEPDTFYLTDHYRNYPYVLVRLSLVHPGTVERLIERRWRATAPKKALKAWDAARPETA